MPSFAGFTVSAGFESGLYRRTDRPICRAPLPFGVQLFFHFVDFWIERMAKSWLLYIEPLII